MNANLEEAAKEWLGHRWLEQDGAKVPLVIAPCAVESLTALLQKVAFEGFRAGQAAGPNASPEPTPPIETA